VQKEKRLIRLFLYITTVTALSWLLQIFVQILGQALVLPVMLPLLLAGLPFNGSEAIAGWLDVDSGPMAAFIFRGIVTGLFWGGCILYPLDTYRRTKRKRFKYIGMSLCVYALIVVGLAVAFFFMLANSGWTD
jgi:hypothetical protein